MDFIKGKDAMGNCLRIALVVLVLSSVGCVSGMRGAPKPPFDPKLVDSTAFLDPKATFDALVAARDTPARNAAMSKLLSLVDLRYAQFRHNVVANRKHASAVTDTLSLAMDLAGGLTTSAGVKDNYLAFSALFQGGGGIYDRNYMFEQTMTALVAQMDANRKAKLLEIRSAMLNQTIDQYPGQVGLADVLDYYYAGTLMGAVAGVQRAASDTETTAAQGLRVLTAPTHQEIASLRERTLRMSRFVDSLAPADAGRLAQFVQGKGLAVAAQPTPAALKNALAGLRDKQYADRFDQLVADLKAAGFTVPD